MAFSLLPSRRSLLSFIFISWAMSTKRRNQLVDSMASRLKFRSINFTTASGPEHFREKRKKFTARQRPLLIGFHISFRLPSPFSCFLIFSSSQVTSDFYPLSLSLSYGRLNWVRSFLGRTLKRSLYLLLPFLILLFPISFEKNSHFSSYSFTCFGAAAS